MAGIAKPLPAQAIEVFVERHWRVKHAGAMIFSSPSNLVWIKIDEMVNELIRCLSFDIKLIEHFCRKMFNVVCDDDIRSAENGGSQYVPIIRIR